jgi:hypothetical protein
MRIFITMLSCFSFLLIFSMNTALAFDDYGDALPYDQQLALNQARTISSDTEQSLLVSAGVYTQDYINMRNETLTLLNKRDLPSLKSKLLKMWIYALGVSKEIKQSYLCFNPKSVNYWIFDLIGFYMKAVDKDLVYEQVRSAVDKNNKAEYDVAQEFMDDFHYLLTYQEDSPKYGFECPLDIMLYLERRKIKDPLNDALEVGMTYAKGRDQLDISPTVTF